MSHKEIKALLIQEKSYQWGIIKLFKFVTTILNNPIAAKEFLIKEGYMPWEVNRAIYNIDYAKLRYQKQLNTATNNRESI